MTTLPSTVDVAIVGAGPTGLATACMLRRHGINAVVLDAAAAPAQESRATVIHSRTLEALETIGLTEKVFEHGDKLSRWSIHDGEQVLVDLDFSQLRTKYPCVVTLPQSKTEVLLRDRLEELGGEIYRSCQVIGVENHGDSVQLDVRMSNNSNAESTSATLTAKYVVAADGLKSTIRSALDIPLEGGEYSASFIAADCRLSSLGPLKPDAIQLYLTQGVFLLFVPEPNDIWRIVATMDNPPKNADVDFYQEMCRRRIGRLADELRISELTWTSRFHIHHRLAKQFRKGRVFLAGDAAHVHSPAGGQGMNIGVQDGLRVGQILSEATLDQEDSEEALNRYEAERRPVAKGVVALTHRITTMATLKSPLLRWFRNCVIRVVMSIPFVKMRAMRQIAELEQ